MPTVLTECSLGAQHCTDCPNREWEDSAGSPVRTGDPRALRWGSRSLITLRLEPTFSQIPADVFTALITLTTH